MKKLRLLSFVIAMVLISSVVLSSCQKQDAKDVSSDIVSSEITSSETSTSEPEKEAETSSTKSENSEKPETSSKPKESSKPTSSKDNTSSDFLSNITINTPFPRPQKEETTSSEPEDDDWDFDSYFSTESYPETELEKQKKLIRDEWHFDLDLAPALIASGYDVKEPIVIAHCYIFDDVTFTLTVADKQAFYDKVGPYVIPRLEKQLRAQLKTEGITESEFRAVMRMSVSDYAKKIFRNQVKTPAYMYGGYFFKDGKLCLRDNDSGTLEKCTYAFIDDDTLVITYDEGSVTVRRHKEETTVTSE